MIQATLFALPQGLAALMLSPLQGVLFALGYSWLAIGIMVRISSEGRGGVTGALRV